jgi:hypothetical protein
MVPSNHRHICRHCSPTRSQPKNVPKEEINKLPIVAWKGPVQVLETRDEMQRAIRTILTESTDCSPSTLSFDTETCPSFVKGEWFPATLVHIATVNTAYLFRICKLREVAVGKVVLILIHSLQSFRSSNHEHSK